jgi:hypothetical protein
MKAKNADVWYFCMTYEDLGFGEEEERRKMTEN